MCLRSISPVAWRSPHSGSRSGTQMRHFLPRITAGAQAGLSRLSPGLQGRSNLHTRDAAHLAAGFWNSPLLRRDPQGLGWKGSTEGHSLLPPNCNDFTGTSDSVLVHKQLPHAGQRHPCFNSPPGSNHKLCYPPASSATCRAQGCGTVRDAG